MSYLKINFELFKSNSCFDFLFGLTKDSTYRSSILEATQIVSIDRWEPYEQKINEKSRFILTLEYNWSDPEDNFMDCSDYVRVNLHFYELSFDETCKMLGKLQLLGDPRKVVGFSLLGENESLASRLEVSG